MGESVSTLAYTPDDVAAFAACVGWPRGRGVPPTFPIRLMTQAAAPFMQQLDAVMQARGVKLVHATQAISVPVTMPEAATVTARVTTGDIPAEGAKERRLSVAAEVADARGNVLATMKSGLMLLPELPTGEGRPATAPADAPEAAFSDADLNAYAQASRDLNPIHTDPAAAQALGLPRPVVHGMLLLGRMASVVAQRYPDRAVTALDCLFLAPVLSGDSVRFVVEPPAGNRARFQIVRGDGTLAVSGSARSGA